MTKSSISAPKTAAEFSALLVQETAAFNTAREEHEGLAEQDADGSVARQGVDALRRHRQLLSDAELRRDVAKANADQLLRQLAEAKQREAAEARRARYDALISGREARQQKYFIALSAAYETIFQTLEAGKAEQDETDAVNRDLPEGAAPVDHFEASMRHVPAVADRYEFVDVQRHKNTGRDVHIMLGQSIPMETVKEQKLIRGNPASRRTPLWEEIVLPDLGRSFANRRVGTLPPANVLKLDSRAGA
jgi:hypothetical protein